MIAIIHMNAETIDSIIRLNNNFYKRVAQSFSNTRQHPWDGWKRVLTYIEENHVQTILDFACGNGRFLDYLISQNIEPKYTGVDSNEDLLGIAEKHHQRHRFFNRDLLYEELPGREKYDMIVSFGFMHHIPTEEMREQVIAKLFGLLNEKGILILTFWSNPNRRGIIPLDKLSGEALRLNSEMGENDFFFGWDNLEGAVRYCHLFNQDEVVSLLNKYRNFELFNADGKTGQDNIYAVIKNI